MGLRVPARWARPAPQSPRRSRPHPHTTLVPGSCCWKQGPSSRSSSSGPSHFKGPQSSPVCNGCLRRTCSLFGNTFLRPLPSCSRLPPALLAEVNIRGIHSRGRTQLLLLLESGDHHRQAHKQSCRGQPHCPAHGHLEQKEPLALPALCRRSPSPLIPP